MEVLEEVLSGRQVLLSAVSVRGPFEKLHRPLEVPKLDPLKPFEISKPPPLLPLREPLEFTEDVEETWKPGFLE